VEFIEGPSLVVDHILSVCKADSIIGFVARNFPKNADSPPAHYVAGRQLYLAPISAVASSPSVRYGASPTSLSTPASFLANCVAAARHAHRVSHAAESHGPCVASSRPHPQERYASLDVYSWRCLLPRTRSVPCPPPSSF
jgi:hypothetical protein